MVKSIERTGAVLLELQELDMAVARTKQELASMPELKRLAQRRRTLQKLKVEETKILARRKDAEMGLEELDEAEREASANVGAAQEKLDSTSDYRRVQEIELLLSDLAKRLEKIGFERSALEEQLEALIEREGACESLREECEKAIRTETRAARAKAEELQADIQAAQTRRMALLDELPGEFAARYERELERRDGLAVEQLEGSVPSVCRTTLSAASLADVRRAGPVGTCPYCGRIIVNLEEAS